MKELEHNTSNPTKVNPQIKEGQRDEIERVRLNSALIPFATPKQGFEEKVVKQ